MVEESGHKPLSAAAAVVRNPLSVIAMFVLLVEAIATITLIQVSAQEPIAFPLVWFVIAFPTLIALLFFSTLWWRHQFLYSPMEYRQTNPF
jgi:membrane protein YdbS with pleckstrin-like domain